jgi:hypothetical protein
MLKNEVEAWKFAEGVDDRGTEHQRNFNYYADLPENLGHFIEIGSGPYTQTQFIYKNKKFDSITFLGFYIKFLLSNQEKENIAQIVTQNKFNATKTQAEEIMQRYARIKHVMHQTVVESDPLKKSLLTEKLVTLLESPRFTGFERLVLQNASLLLGHGVGPPPTFTAQEAGDFSLFRFPLGAEYPLWLAQAVAPLPWLSVRFSSPAFSLGLMLENHLLRM